MDPGLETKGFIYYCNFTCDLPNLFQNKNYWELEAIKDILACSWLWILNYYRNSICTSIVILIFSKFYEILFWEYGKYAIYSVNFTKLSNGIF